MLGSKGYIRLDIFKDERIFHFAGQSSGSSKIESKHTNKTPPLKETDTHVKTMYDVSK